MQFFDLASKDFRKSIFIRLTFETGYLERERCTLLSKNRLTCTKNLQRAHEIIFNTWKSLPDLYNQLKFVFGVLNIFGFPCMCEQTFFN